MKIDKYEKISSSKYRLFLSNGEVIDTYDNVILNLDLLLKSDISISDYNKILNDTVIYDKYNACLKYIQVRIRSTKEIRDYLRRKNASDEEIEIIIDKLIASGNLNDDYFVSCFIKDKLRFTSWGPYKVLNELKKHNIDSDIINKYLYLFDDTVVRDKLDRLIDKQINSNRKDSNMKLKNKLYNNFMRLGYKSGMILDILNYKL